MNCIQLLNNDTELIVLKYLKQRRHYYQFYKPILCKTIGLFNVEWNERIKSEALFKFLLYNNHLKHFRGLIDTPIRGRGGVYIREYKPVYDSNYIYKVNSYPSKDKKYNTIYNLRKCIKNNNEIMSRIKEDNISKNQQNQALKFYRMSNTYLKIKTQLKILNYWSSNGTVNKENKKSKYRKCYTNHRLWDYYSGGKEDYRFTPRDFKTMNNNLDKNINKKTSDYIINGPY